MVLNPNLLKIFMALICLLMMPVFGAAFEPEAGGDGGWRCGDGVLASAAATDGEISERGWFCPWCNRYAPPAPARETPETGCISCDPHYAPFNGVQRFSGNQVILIVEGLLRMSGAPDLMAASILERDNIYEARLIDDDGVHVDTLHIHKANGWVRSLSTPY